MDLLIQFLRFAIPLLPGISDVARDFWGQNSLGPMPPDLAEWDAIDQRINRERETRKE